MTILSRIADAVAKNENNRLQVKLYRSVIGLPEKYMRIAESLGLKRTHQTSFVKVTPYTVGQIVKIKELVKVKLIEKSQVPPPGYLKAPQGFRIVGNMLTGMPI